jgi:hypothetical protein
MFPSFEDSTRLIHNLSESYSVEVKSWFDPMSIDGKAKLIKAMIALRNNNGGRLVIGFDDDSMNAVAVGRPSSVRDAFGQDAIQALATKYSSDPFEVLVQYPENDGLEFPVVCVPPGVRTPVATKGELKDPTTPRPIVPINVVYVRTLNSNNTVSTSAAKWQDWERLCGHCFDNREADIGRFMRRHLDESMLPRLVALLNTTGQSSPVDVATLSTEWLDVGRRAFDSQLAQANADVPKIGYFEMAAVIVGELKEGLAPNQSMLNLIRSANRRFTGLPFFATLDSAAQHERPQIVSDAWERLFIDLTHQWGDAVDFWRIESTGKLYAIRGFDEDLSEDLKSSRILTILLPILRVADALIEAVSIGRAMVQTPEDASLAVTLRWTNLADRRLSRARSNRFWTTMGGASIDDIATSSLTLPLDLPDSALAQRTGAALAPLYRKFQGFEIGQNVVDAEVQEMLSRTF